MLGLDHPPGDVFDYQITPLKALIDILTNDFRGAFEMDDLAIVSHHAVMHKTLLTEHPHVFHGAGELLTQSELDEQYPAAREAFDRRVARFRELSGPVCFVRAEAMSLKQTASLQAALGDRKLITCNSSASVNWWGDNGAWDDFWASHLSLV